MSHADAGQMIGRQMIGRPEFPETLSDRDVAAMLDAIGWPHTIDNSAAMRLAVEGLRKHLMQPSRRTVWRAIAENKHAAEIYWTGDETAPGVATAVRNWLSDPDVRRIVVSVHEVDHV